MAASVPSYLTAKLSHGVKGAGVLGLTPLEDQQLAGMLMWVPPGVVYLAVIVVLLRRWFAELEARTPRVSEPVAPVAVPEDVR